MRHTRQAIAVAPNYTDIKNLFAPDATLQPTLPPGVSNTPVFAPISTAGPLPTPAAPAAPATPPATPNPQVCCGVTRGIL